MKPAFNLERKCRVTMCTREDWIRSSGSPPEVKGLDWYTDGSKMKEGTEAGIYGQSVKRGLKFSLGRYTTVFQAEIYAILACVYEIQSYIGTEKYISICCDSQAALKVLQAVRTTSPPVHHCQEGLNDISACLYSRLLMVEFPPICRLLCTYLSTECHYRNTVLLK
jgi:hypothetical protein